MTDTSFLSGFAGLGIPNAKTVPITDINSQSDLLDLKRKQAIAGLLLQQSQQPDTTPQEIGGHYVRRSPLLALSKAAQMMMGVKMGADAEAQGVQLQKDALGRLMGAAGAAGGQSAPASPLGTQVQANDQSGLPWQTGQAIPAPMAPQQATGGEPSPGGSSPLAIRNMTPEQRAILLQLAPEEYMKTFSAQFAPTDMQKNDAYMGINPNQSKTLHLAEQAKNIGVSGALPSLDASGNMTIAPIPGAIPTQAAMSGAIKAAEQQNTILPNMSVNGRENVPVWGGDIPRISQGGKPSKAEIDQIAQANGGVPAGGGAPQFGSDIGDKEAKIKNVAELGNLQKEIDDKAESSIGIRQNLSEMRNLSKNFDPNAANELKLKMGAVAQGLGMPESEVNKFLNTNVGSLGAFQKITAQLAIETVKQISSRATQMEFVKFLENNPNILQSPEGFKRVVDYMDGIAKQHIDKQAEFTKFKEENPASKWVNFPSHYNQTLSKKIDEGAFNSPSPANSPTKTKSDFSNVQDGATAVNPKTGKRLIRKGGVWQDM